MVEFRRKTSDEILNSPPVSGCLTFTVKLFSLIRISQKISELNPSRLGNLFSHLKFTLSLASFKMSDNVLDSCRQIEIPCECLDVRNHPTPTDLERNISKELVEVHLKNCTPIEKSLLGRDKPLKGPGSLWISPDDRLSCNQVRLTPSKAESVQALTHQGILEIGKRLEEKLEEKNLELTKEAVAEAEELAK